MAADRRLSLALDVAAVLRRHEIEFALIGATALAVYGYARATYDVDFMVADRAVFTLPWSDTIPQASVDIRRGEFDDPIGGVIRFTASDADPVDVVVARWKWEAQLLSRCIETSVGGEKMPVPTAGDLVLLKIAAGGPKDLIDAGELVSSDPGALTHLREFASTLPERLRADVERFVESVRSA